MEEKDRSQQEVEAALMEMMKDKRIMKTFDLSPQEVRELMKIRVSSVGFDVSPNFQSAGWGENEDDYLAINLSDLGNGRGVLKHELKHAMHCTVCATLFRGDRAEEMFKKFVKNVIGDPGFEEWRSGSVNKRGQEEWAKVQEMMKNPDRETIKKSAMMLGSIAYQHAYYVDPGLCEAAASTEDRGFLSTNGLLNRVVGLLIPGSQYIEGYGDIEAQNEFGRASLEKKALMVKKADYDRKRYFRD